MTISQPKVEIKFDGSTWSDVTAWVRLRDGITLKRGRSDETGDAMSPGTCTLSLDNNAGEFSPGLSSSAHYPYVVTGVPIRVSMWNGAAYVVRFYGTVQDWNVEWLNPLGTQAKCTVSAIDSLGSLPAYSLRQASDEVVRTANLWKYHWPLRDSQSPATALIGAGSLTDNGKDGWGGGTLLPLDEGSTPHPLFTNDSSGLQVTTPAMSMAPSWQVAFVVMEAPTASLNLARVYAGGNSWTISYSTSSGYRLGSGTYVAEGAYPLVIGLSRLYDGDVYVRLDVASATTTGYQEYTTTFGATDDPGALTKVRLNPSLSGGGSWSGGHLTISDLAWSTDIPTHAQALLQASRVMDGAPQWVMDASLAGGGPVTVSGAPQMSLPLMEGRKSADVLGAMLAGSGARLATTATADLTWIPFPPATATITLPAAEIDPSFTWGTSDVGEFSDVTVTWPDGSSYTATRDDSKAASQSIEGVHVTKLEDRSYADWLVAGVTDGPRMPRAPYDLATLGDTDTATLCTVAVGSRVYIASLPPQMPSTATLIVEGVDEQITDASWTLTLSTSPDVYSLLGVYGTSTYDSGVVYAP